MSPLCSTSNLYRLSSIPNPIYASQSKSLCTCSPRLWPLQLFLLSIPLRSFYSPPLPYLGILSNFLMRNLFYRTEGVAKIDATDEGVRFLIFYANTSSKSIELPWKGNKILALWHYEIPLLEICNVFIGCKKLYILLVCCINYDNLLPYYSSITAGCSMKYRT